MVKLPVIPFEYPLHPSFPDLLDHLHLHLVIAFRQGKFKDDHHDNIRELENLIESLYVFHDTVVDAPDLPLRIRKVETALSLHWKDAEREHIRKVLEHFNGNKRKSCFALGYGSPNTLVKKIREYGIE